MFFLPRVLIPMLLLAALELAFRHGAWEMFAKPLSHTGEAVRVKRAVAELANGKIDFAVIGDSRTHYGIDHAAIDADAKSMKLSYGSLAISGTHWMSTKFIAEWIKSASPTLQDGMIATSVSGFTYLGNGSYEINIAAPFIQQWDSDWMSKSVPFDWHDMSSYGVYSSLFQYREDMQDLVKHPLMRFHELSWYWNSTPVNNTLRQTLAVAENICRVPINSLTACAAATPGTAVESETVTTCKQFAAGINNRLDYRAFNTPQAPAHLAEIMRVRQAQLRAMPFKHPYLVVLMPSPKIWLDAFLPKGTEAWTHAIFQPLIDDGTIELLDYTHTLDTAEGTDCTAYRDLYHTNSVGQQRLMQVLQPHLHQKLSELVLAH